MNALAFASSMINKKESLEMSPSNYTPPSFKSHLVAALLSRISGIRRFLALAAAAALLGSTAQAAPIDLSSWTIEGNGVWTLENGNLDVRLTNQSGATVFYSDETSFIGTSISATITPYTPTVVANDDDFIGFVIGFQPGDLTTTATSNYILIDWKKADQTANGCGAKAGLSISLVNAPATAAGFWCHQSEVTELQRAATFGSTGYNYNQSYNFRIDFTNNRINVYVNGVLELSVSGSFSDGRFGFYNNSQDNAVYSGVTRATIVPQAIPVNQATWMLIFGIGLFALYGIRRRSKKA